MPQSFLPLQNPTTDLGPCDATLGDRDTASLASSEDAEIDYTLGYMSEARNGLFIDDASGEAIDTFTEPIIWQ